MTDPCLICEARESSLATDGGAFVAPFLNPQVPGHLIVGSDVHERFIDDLPVATAEAAGRLVQSSVGRLRKAIDGRRVYVAVVGDRDLHFHYHLLPMWDDSAVLGPFLFGPEGWASAADKSTIEDFAARLRDQWPSLS